MSEDRSFEACAVIMAGGRGTRFWPLSRRSRPKQFLPIVTPRPMIVETVDRLRPILAPASMFTISDQAQAVLIRKLIPDLPAANVLVEPEGRNTAPSLILATAEVYLRNSRAVVFALPADHLITRPAIFRRKLRAAANAASAGEVIVTFGIPPTFPATGFGYIHYDADDGRRFAREIFYPVLRFKEKPRLAQARAFIKKGNHAWNSGMFIWRAEVFARKLERYAPDFFAFWPQLLAALRSGDRAGVTRVFRRIPAISIDYALMERAEGVLMNPGDFGWSDVGSWSAAFDLSPKDENENAVRGEGMVLDSRRCLVHSPRRLAAVVGLEDVIIIDTEDALLVCRRDRDQAVREIIDRLERQGKTKYL